VVVVSIEVPRIPEDIKLQLRRHGVREIKEFKVKGSSAEKVEESFRDTYENSIVNAIREGDHYIVEVYILKEGLSELQKTTIESYVYLSGLERFAVTSGDDDFRHLTQKYVRANKKLVTMMSATMMSL
jgi:hypothetical protein